MSFFNIKDRKVQRQSNYLENLSDIIKISADKAGISVDLGEYLLDEFFFRFRELLEDTRLILIRIPYLGLFQVTKNRLRANMLMKIRSFKKGNIPRYKAEIVVKKNWKIYRRIVNTKYDGTRYLVDNFYWNSLIEEETNGKELLNLHTKLPDRYHIMKIEEWRDSFLKEQRFEKKLSTGYRLELMYNVIRNRLIYIDKIPNIDKKFRSYKRIRKKYIQGRVENTRLRMRKKAHAVLLNNYSWTRHRVKKPEKFGNIIPNFINKEFKFKEVFTYEQNKRNRSFGRQKQ